MPDVREEAPLHLTSSLRPLYITSSNRILTGRCEGLVINLQNQESSKQCQRFALDSFSDARKLTLVTVKDQKGLDDILVRNFGK